MKKTTIAIVGVFLPVLLAAAFGMPETTGGKLRVKALNPEFVRNRLEAKAGRVVHFSRTGHPLGFVPSPVNLSNVRLPKVLNKHAAYPARYDLRTLNKVTPVRDQGSCGSCWAFATTASMESFLMPGEEKNFSEQNLNARHGFDYAECEGGNSWMAAAYFTRWDGPVLESEDPYPYYEAADPTVRKHIQQALLLPARKNYLDNNTAKYLITAFGAVEASFAYDDDYYSYAHSSYYCTSEDESNHSVVLVGWDDDYPAANFRTPAPGNGAFIVKNSWGTSWGDDGFFYLSYYDRSLDTMSCFNNAEPVINYQRIYQYDPLGWTTNVGAITGGGSAQNGSAASTTGWGANVFTARDNLPLRAVGFYTTDTNVKYEIRVYRNVQAGRPRSGTLAATRNGTFLYSGFHTVALAAPVALETGERFSVVIRFANTADPYPVPVEMPIDGYSSNAAAEAGQSFASFDGTSWEDISAALEGTNVCIKAYAADDSVALTVRAGAHGTTDPVPAIYRVPKNSEFSVLAVPDLHAAFTGWTGASTGTENPVTITVDAPGTLTANFQVILGPSGASGTRVLNRSFSQAEYINVLSWQANPGNQGLNVTSYRIYRQGASAVMLAEVPATQFQYRHRQAGTDAAVYAVAAVTSDGREGEASTISIPKE